MLFDERFMVARREEEDAMENGTHPKYIFLVCKGRPIE